jgi:hypothetical protein
MVNKMIIMEINETHITIEFHVSPGTLTKVVPPDWLEQFGVALSTVLFYKTTLNIANVIMTLYQVMNMHPFCKSVAHLLMQITFSLIKITKTYNFLDLC